MGSAAANADAVVREVDPSGINTHKRGANVDTREVDPWALTRRINGGGGCECEGSLPVTHWVLAHIKRGCVVVKVANGDAREVDPSRQTRQCKSEEPTRTRVNSTHLDGRVAVKAKLADADAREVDPSQLNSQNEGSAASCGHYHHDSRRGYCQYDQACKLEPKKAPVAKLEALEPRA